MNLLFDWDKTINLRACNLIKQLKEEEISLDVCLSFIEKSEVYQDIKDFSKFFDFSQYSLEVEKYLESKMNLSKIFSFCMIVKGGHCLRCLFLI